MASSAIRAVRVGSSAIRAALQARVASSAIRAARAALQARVASSAIRAARVGSSAIRAARVASSAIRGAAFRNRVNSSTARRQPRVLMVCECARTAGQMEHVLPCNLTRRYPFLTTMCRHRMPVTRNAEQRFKHLCRFHVCRRENADGTLVDYATAAQKPAGSRIGKFSTATRRGIVGHIWSDMLPLEGAQ